VNRSCAIGSGLDLAARHWWRIPHHYAYISKHPPKFRVPRGFEAINSQKPHTAWQR
jgi:hypothetical protein